MEEGQIRVATLRHARLRFWVQRYLPPELVGTSAALAAAAIAASRGVEEAVVAAAWAEAIAFYVFVTVREFRALRRSRRAAPALLGAVRDVVAEFGVAEAADTMLLRPLLMYSFAAALGGLIPGVIAGKLISDVAFYGLAIPAYELRERARQ
jgi:hypothetical protein